MRDEDRKNTEEPTVPSFLPPSSLPFFSQPRLRSAQKPLRVLLCAPNSHLAQELRTILFTNGPDAWGSWELTSDSLGVCLFGPEVSNGLLRQSWDLAIVDGSDTASAESALSVCHRLRSEERSHSGGQSTLQLLLITNNTALQSVQWSSMASCPDAFLQRPFSPLQLHTQLQLLLRVKDLQERLNERNTELNRLNHRLQAAYQQIDQELELAGRLQHSFRPRSIPVSVPGVRLGLQTVVSDQYAVASGDFYKVFAWGDPQDTQHQLGFYLADVMGHGVSACLLTVLVQNLLRFEVQEGALGRWLSPEEVLLRLNRELLAQQLTEQPLLGLVCGRYNAERATLQFARGGLPPPLYVPRQGKPSLWRSEGLLLGLSDAHFSVQSLSLQLGDKVIFYTDGIEQATFRESSPGLQSVLACTQQIQPWEQQGAPKPVSAQEFVTFLGHELFRTTLTDDVTMIALERVE